MAGLHRLSDTSQSQSRLVAEKITHPGYPAANGIGNDIALLRLAEPLDLTGYDVNMVCMPDQNEEVPLDKNCFVGGWGTLESGGDMPDELQSVDVTIYEDSVCASLLDYMIKFII